MTTYEEITAIMAEQKEWSLQNFGPTTPENINNPLLGVIEELGELSKAVLKKNQGIRGTSQKHNAAAVDAVGDMLIFVIDAMNRGGVTLSEANYQFVLSELPPSVGEEDPFFVYSYEITYWVRKAARRNSDETLARRNSAEALFRVMMSIRRMALFLNIDPMEALVVTWKGVVSKRNWVANPDTGNNSSVLRKAHEDGVIRLSGEHIHLLEQAKAGELSDIAVMRACQEITQTHYAQLLEGGLV